MNRSYHFILGLAVVVSLTVLVLVATPAQACSGYGCDGKDPIAEGCNDDAYTVDIEVVPNGTLWVELRYSPSCGTNWARTGSSIFLYHQADVRSGSRREPFSGGGYGVYTDMLYCPTGSCTAAACVFYKQEPVPYCTGYY